MRRTVLLAATALCATLSAPGHAQPAAAAGGTAAAPADAPAQDGIADIVVTAQRRQERAQSVPIAISAFSGEQLRTQGVSNTLQLGQLIPNLVAQSNTGVGSANAYFLRGLGNTESIATFDPPVGTYVDDIYLSRQNANNLSLFDVERVEVLRGPQGTLFGRNTTGGAINVIMRKPNLDRVGGYAEAGYGSYDKVVARASIDLPLALTFAIKASGFYQHDKGYVRNVTTGDRLNDDNGLGARLAVRGELASWARWNASYAYIESDAENSLNFECNPAAPTQCDGRYATTGLREGRTFATSPYAPLVITGRKARFGLGNYTQQHLITSTLDVDLAAGTTLSVITGFVSLKQQFALDFFDGRSAATLNAPNPPALGYARGGFDFLNDGYHTQFTQELKLAGRVGDLVNYVAGAYYIDEDNRTDLADVFSVSPAASLLLGDRLIRNGTRAYAGYAQADLNVTRQLTLTAGIRYTDETKKISVADQRAACAVANPAATCLFDGNLVAATGVRIPRRQQVKLWTPRFAVNFKPDRDLLFYASATRGFKSGGWNARATAPSQFLPFAPEKVWSYEAGTKTELFNHRVRANLTGFYIDAQDLQVISGAINPATGAFTSITRNFADYRNRGVEAELTVVPTRGLNLFANVGYQKDKYVLPANAPAVDIYGIASIRSQQATCRAQLAAGQIPGSVNTAPAGAPLNNAPSCGAGIVDARGNIATPVRTPDWSLALGGSYQLALSDRLSLVPNVNAAYRSAQEVQIANYTIYTGSITGSTGTFPSNPYSGSIISGSRSKANWIVNAGLALKAGDAWTLSVECQNCFNETVFLSAIGNYSYLNQPRMFMSRLRYSF